MNKYSYFSEKQALLDSINSFLEKAGDEVLEFYLEKGFDALSIRLDIWNDLQRKTLFDYLMIERKALLACIRRNKKFFLKMITDGQGEMIRPMLGIVGKKYDILWREALDLMSLYFVEKKVIEKMTNFELDKFFDQNDFGEGKTN